MLLRRAEVRRSTWALIEYGWPPFLLFLTTPYFVHALGIERYGLWMLLNAAVGLGAVLNVGTGAATSRQVSTAIARGDTGALEYSVRSALTVALICGAVLAVLIFGIFWVGATGLFSDMGSPESIRVTGTAAACLIWLEQIDCVYTCSLRGAEHFGYGARAELGGRTAQTLGCSVAVAVTGDLGWLYVALIVTALLRTGIKMFFTKRLLCLATLWPATRADPALLKLSKWGWLLGLSGVVFAVADRLVIASALGAASLARYSIAAQLAQQIHGIPAAALSVVFPMISKRAASGASAASMWRVLRKSTVVGAAISTALTLVVIAFGRTILTLWIGVEEAEATHALLMLLSIAYCLLAVNIAPYNVLLGVGAVRALALLAFISSGVAISLLLLGVEHFGLSGAASGRIAYSVLSFAMFALITKELQERRASSAADSP